MVGAHPCLFPQRRDQAVALAAMLHALADRVDARVVGLHGVVDHDPALAVNAGCLDEADVGTDADRHHHQIGGNFQTVLEAHAPNPLLAENGDGLRAQQKPQAAFLQAGSQQGRRLGVELPFHQHVEQMDDGDLHALFHQTVGRFQTEQAAADHHRVFFAGPGRVQHRVDILDVAEGDDARQIVAGHRQDDGIGTGRQQQPVIGRERTVSGDDLPPRPIDLGHGLAGVQGDAALGVPVQIVEHDLLDRLLARQHRRQQNAVVIAVRFGAKHGDVVLIGSNGQQLFQGAHPGHAVADQNQFLFFHAISPRGTTC